MAVGVQGLAPYMMDVEATAYLGGAGRTALRLTAACDLRITSRLVLQPQVELDLYGEDDPETGVGSGLSQAEAGLRLRYEIRRELAPYLGVTWQRRFGDTADFARTAGEGDSDTRLVAGLRVWF
jgi:copper resistance protein B